MALVLVGLNPTRPAFPSVLRALEDGAARGRLLSQLRGGPGIEEALLLATPGRLELYLQAAAGLDAYETALAALAAVAAPGASLTDQGYYGAGRDAAAHLLAAVAGLDEFAGAGGEAVAAALRQGAEEARRAGTAGPALAALGAAAQRLAARLESPAALVGRETMAATALALAGRVFDHVERRRVLVLGVNPLVEATARAFAARGVTDFTFIGSAEHGDGARQQGARVGAREGLAVLLGAADVVLVAEAPEGTTLDRRLVRGALRARRGRTSLVLDLAEGPVVDGRVADFDGAVLYTAADVQAIAADAGEGRPAASGQREALLDEAVQAFTWESFA